MGKCQCGFTLSGSKMWIRNIGWDDAVVSDSVWNGDKII